MSSDQILGWPPGVESGIAWRNIVAVALGLIACLQMAGYVVGCTALRGIGAASAVAPLPKVFSDVDGLETFASEFTLRFRDDHGVVVEKPITPEMYGRIGGPYNRRNVYGAALSYAPRLPEPLWASVYCYGLGPHGPLRSELGMGEAATDVSVVIQTKTFGRSDVWTLDPLCKP